MWSVTSGLSDSRIPSGLFELIFADSLKPFDAKYQPSLQVEH
jgi:hypothetical protein